MEGNNFECKMKRGGNNKGERGERRESTGERREKCQILENGGKMVERVI